MATQGSTNLDYRGVSWPYLLYFASKHAAASPGAPAPTSADVRQTIKRLTAPGTALAEMLQQDGAQHDAWQLPLRPDDLLDRLAKWAAERS